GVEALGLLRRDGADVLLLDLNLPHKNGFEILEELGPAGTASLRVIVMSEQVQDDKIIRAFSLGAHDFVQKPLNPRVVVSRIQRLLRSE
ncbi:MAG: response regulator, partial [Myxococcales bacterium]|nr:response regulator [Myxococcales bacterium]